MKQKQNKNNKNKKEELKDLQFIVAKYSIIRKLIFHTPKFIQLKNTSF